MTDDPAATAFAERFRDHFNFARQTVLELRPNGSQLFGEDAALIAIAAGAGFEWRDGKMTTEPCAVVKIGGKWVVGTFAHGNPNK